MQYQCLDITSSYCLSNWESHRAALRLQPSSASQLGIKGAAAQESATLKAMVSAKSPVTWCIQLPQTFKHVGPNHSVGTLADRNPEQIWSAILQGADAGSGFQLYPKTSQGYNLYTAET